MYTIFSENTHHKITEANINFYASPFIHPKRTMTEHDFIYVLQGEWKFGQNDETYTIGKNDLLILSANNTHFGTAPCLPNTKTMYFHASNENDITDTVPRDGLCIKSLTNTGYNSNIKKYFSEIVNCKLQGKQKKADIYFNLLLCELCDKDSFSPAFSVPQKIKSIIHNNPEKFFSNTELAEKCNVSVRTAETQFKTVYGSTIHQYILRFKIDEAVNCFKNFPEISIKETACNLGFYDEYHFSKQFKNIIGISPSKYKNIK